LYMCDERWAFHVVIKLKVFFTFIIINSGADAATTLMQSI